MSPLMPPLKKVKYNDNDNNNNNNNMDEIKIENNMKSTNEYKLNDNDNNNNNNNNNMNVEHNKPQIEYNLNDNDNNNNNNNMKNMKFENNTNCSTSQSVSEFILKCHKNQNVPIFKVFQNLYELDDEILKETRKILSLLPNRENLETEYNGNPSKSKYFYVTDCYKNDGIINLKNNHNYKKILKYFKNIEQKIITQNKILTHKQTSLSLYEKNVMSGIEEHNDPWMLTMVTALTFAEIWIDSCTSQQSQLMKITLQKGDTIIFNQQTNHKVEIKKRKKNRMTLQIFCNFSK